MKHVLPLLVILLYHQYDVTLSSVINDGFPDEIADCRDVGTSKMYKCIRSKFYDPDWIPDSGPKLQLRLRQDFYWHPTRRIRRECRAIPREEWHALCDAINTLKKDKSLFPNVYDYIADYHTNEAVNSVHFGPNFFGWHRIFILMFEELLRKVNPNVTLCYWDSRLDYNMKRTDKSIMFTEEFFGNTKGPVVTGPFAGWKTIRNIPLRRNSGEEGVLISPKDIERVLSRDYHVQITTPTSDPKCNVETMHNMVHAYIGGQMNDFNTSSQDICFWFHHAFIDSVWEQFCTKLRSKGLDPQEDYVIVDDKMHKPRRVMDHFFPFRNIHGYSDYFPRNIYDYEEYATCPDCLNSPYLKCNTKTNKCYSVEKDEPLRVVENPPPKIETNHLSAPKDDFTVLSGDENLDSMVFVPIKIVFREALHKSIRKQNIAGCEYEENDVDLCKKSVAVVESRGMSYHGNYRNYVINDACVPQWIYAFVGVRDPEHGESISFVSVTDKLGTHCYAYCLDLEEKKYRSCSGVIKLTADKPRMYSKTLNDAKESGFPFSPLEADSLDPRIQLSFLCY